MKNFKLIFLIVLTLTLTFSAFSQRRFDGKVVEVIDGKTAVVQMSNGGKLTIILQYIEIPEPDQPLHQIVKEHLQKLILNQNVEINPRGLAGNATTVGQIFLKDVDISRQMLRDGAAWFAILENGGQSPAQSESYQSHESQAKAEKRGVWGIEGMKPAWEFRAAREEARQAAERAEFEKIKNENQARQNAEAEARKKEREEKLAAAQNRQLNFDPSGYNNFDSAMWENAAVAGMTNENGLIVNRFPQYNAEVIFTSPNFLTLTSGKTSHEIECQFGYFTYNYMSSGEKEFYGFACKSESDKELFKKSNQLTFTADGKKTTVSKAIQLGKQTDQRFNELLIYDVDRDFVVQLAQSKKVNIKIGEFSGLITEKLHAMTKSMILEIAKK